jgi:hypothetical protein
MALVVIANTTMPTSVKSTVSNLHAISFPESESVGCDGKHNRGRHWPKVQLQESARRVRNEEQPVPLSRLCCTYLTHNGLQRCGPFCYAGEHDGFAESVCSGLRPQKPWRRVVVRLMIRMRDNAQKSTGKSGRLFAGGESPPARMGFFAGDRIKGS